VANVNRYCASMGAEISRRDDTQELLKADIDVVLQRQILFAGITSSHLRATFGVLRLIDLTGDMILSWLYSRCLVEPPRPSLWRLNILAMRLSSRSDQLARWDLGESVSSITFCQLRWRATGVPGTIQAPRCRCQSLTILRTAPGHHIPLLRFCRSWQPAAECVNDSLESRLTILVVDCLICKTRAMRMMRLECQNSHQPVLKAF
jgi:hypothetical protein